MESLKPNVFLKFNNNQLTEVRKLFNYDDNNRLLQDIDIFEDWIRKQNHFRVRNFDREFLERYLIYNKGSIERAKKHFDKLCTYRTLMPEFLQNFNIKNEFHPLLYTTHVTMMPQPTPDNYRVGVIRVFENHEKMDLVSFYRFGIMACEYMLQHDYSAGYEIVYDTRDMPYSFLAKLNPVIMRKGISIIVETMGQRIKGMHFLSGSRFFDTVLSLFRSAMSEKLNKRTHVHDSLESLHNLVPKDCLPADYGGKGKTLEEYHDIYYKLLCTDEHISRMKFLETASTDETCRLSSTFNEEYSGTPGSFKKMCLD